MFSEADKQLIKSLITQHRSVYLTAVTLGSKEQRSSIIRTQDKECLEKVKEEEQLNRYRSTRNGCNRGGGGHFRGATGGA